MDRFKEKDIFEVLHRAKQNGLSENDLFRLAKGFVEQKARESGTPFHGHFELTPLCNLDCKMCYVHLTESQLQGRKLLPVETWLNLMQQAIDAGMVSANLSGGECLTYPHFDEVYLFLRAKGIETSILTNGVLLNKERIDFFQKNQPQVIQVSLYGHSEESYERVTGKRVYSRVFENIVVAKEAGLPIRLAITPSFFLKETAKETILLAKELDIPYTITLSLLTPRDETGRSKFEADITLDEYIEIFKFNRSLNQIPLNPQKAAPLECGGEQIYKNSGVKCGAGRSGFSIRWDGSMHPCTQMDSIEAKPIQDGFKASWDYINREVNSYPRFEKCENCAYSDACTFCTAENEKMGSRYCLNPEWCERTKKMVESGLRTIYTGSVN